MKKEMLFSLAWLFLLWNPVIGQAGAGEWSFIGVADTHSGDGFATMLQWATANLVNPAPSFLIHAGDQEASAKSNFNFEDPDPKNIVHSI